MINRYEQEKQLRESVHKDMECRVAPEAKHAFDRKAYERRMIGLTFAIHTIQTHAYDLDEWEKETLRRIAQRVRGEENR